MHKDKLRLVVFNIVSILCLLALAEFGAYVIGFVEGNKYVRQTKYYKGKLDFPRYDFTYRDFDSVYKEISFRPTAGPEYKKRPIVIFGCSFAYGNQLEDDQIFSYKLSRLTHRTVYNRAWPSWGIQQMLWQLQHESKLDEIKNPEYVIFVFINDQLRRLRTDYFQPNERLWQYINYPYMTYIEKGGKRSKRGKEDEYGKLEIKKHPFHFLYNFFLTDYLAYYSGFRRHTMSWDNPRESNKLGRLVKLHFMESRDIINQKWPGAKIVILKYQSNQSLNRTWSELDNDGFIVLDANEITGINLDTPEFQIPDTHPNEAAWDVLVPALVKKLRIK